MSRKKAPPQQPGEKLVISRRQLLKLCGLGLSSLAGCRSRHEEAALEEFEVVDFDPLHKYPYRGWEALYRKQFSWDRVVRSTHSANCTGSCSWKVFVKDGIMVREEQAADYPAISDDLPDYNPRGCQKGACFVEYVYGAQRVKYPLIRAGERGDGKWRRVSWDEALDRIAAKLVENIYEHGPDTNTFFTVIPAMSPVSFCSGVRLAHLIGGVACSFYDWYCDLPPGEPITWGVQTEACECADWFNAKYIVLWGSNINETRIPDAHFAWEARYNGARVVCIAPEFNASAVHADQFLAIRPGTDSLLALGACRYIIEHGHVAEEYVRRQTDMPLLVRLDNQRLLRGTDIGWQEEGSDADKVFFAFDEASGAPKAMPGTMGHPSKTLDLDGWSPALEGTFAVTLTDGTKVQVTTVFQQLRGQLMDDRYGLDRVAAETGLTAADVKRFYHDLATRKPAMIVHGAGTNHWYHNDLINRAMMLSVALTGNVGVNGGGFNHYVGQERVWPEHGLKKLAFPRGGKHQRFQNTTLWTYCHSKMADPHKINGKTPEHYILESVRNGWMPLWPRNDWDSITPEQLHDLPRKPRALLVWRANYLNQAKGNEAIIASLWKDLDLIVDVNFRMDTTALYSDIVLPAASYYEKADLSSTDCHSFMHPIGAVLDPLYESKPDWEIFGLLAKAIAKEVERRNLPPFQDKEVGWTHDLRTAYDEWSDNGKLTTGEDAANFILQHAVETKGMSYQTIQEAPQRFVATDPEAWNSDIEPGRAYTPFTHQIEKQRPWRTLTGRQQFYIDHPWFLEFGEALPIHKPPQDDPKFPLYWNTPHGRWSIHSTWRDNRYMLRLQRGLPIVYLHPDEATSRGIQDNDWVRVYNDEGQAVVKAKIKPAEMAGRLTMYHGWEKYLGFQEGGWQSLSYIKIKPTQLVGGYGHLNFRLNYWGPTGNNRDIKVEIERYEGPVAAYEPLIKPMDI